VYARLFYYQPWPPTATIEPALTWVVTPTTATVAGYAYQRAAASSSGRQWETWLTREVPVSEGPHKISSLPGPIVKVGDTRQHYVFELASLKNPATECRISRPRQVCASTDRATFRQALAT
jgi:GLPGLI family protein